MRRGIRMPVTDAGHVLRFGTRSISGPVPPPIRQKRRSPVKSMKNRSFSRMEEAPVFHFTCLGSDVDLVQSLLQVGNDVVGVLQPHREADQTGGDTRGLQLLFTVRGVGHGGGMLNQGLGSA